MGSIIDSVLSSPAGEILTFRAFDYQLGDVSVPLEKRFAGRQLLLLSIGSRSMKLGVVSFDQSGKAKVRPNSQLLTAKTGGALTEHLKSVVKATGTKGGAPWVVVMIANGWTVEHINQNFHGPDFERMQRLREVPEDVVGKTLPTDMEHAVIPHPLLEASLLFSVRQSLVLPVLEAVKAAGLRIARVQISIASLIESYFRAEPEGAQARDILAYDHQGALLLQIQKKEWVKLRFRSTQPNEMANDLSKFLMERSDRTAPLTVLGGPSDALEQAFQTVGRPSEVEFPFTTEDPEFEAACFSEKEHIAHDVNPDRPEARPPLPKIARVFVVGYMIAALTLTGLIAANLMTALSRENLHSNLKREKDEIEQRISRSEVEERRQSQETAKADEIAAWVRVGYNPQRFLLAVLKSVPPTVVLGNIEAKLSEGLLQMDLVVNLEGSPDAQTAAMASIEQSIYAQGIRIVTREPAANGNRSISYRLTLILPAPGDATPL